MPTTLLFFLCGNPYLTKSMINFIAIDAYDLKQSYKIKKMIL